METEIIPANHPFALSHAYDVLKHRGLVAFPTDTVYGLAALAFDSEAIEQLYVVKGGEQARIISILINSKNDLGSVTVRVNQTTDKLAKHFWPGPLTLVVSRHPNVPKIISPDSSIYVRVPNHPVALALLRLAGSLAVTTANLPGHNHPTTALEVLNQLSGRIHLVLDGGQTPGSVLSTVVECKDDEPIILRQGPITLEDIRTVLNS